MKFDIKKISLSHILFVALILRLVAVFFSKGFAFHDDHFEVIELAWRWNEGIPVIPPGEPPYVFSLLYPGLHLLLFNFCYALGVNDPQDILLFIRFLHALISLLTVYYGFKITERLTGNDHTAKLVAIAMAVFWLFPFFSVRNLREFLCVPFLFAGTYYALSIRPALKHIILAAFFFNLAICIRLQAVFIPFGIGLFWIFRKDYFKPAIILALASAVFFFLTQGVFDWQFYGDPLGSTWQYFKYNSNPENLGGYPQGPWYHYLGTLAFMFLGPAVLVFLLGYIRTIKMSWQLKMLFFSSLIFFVFHSYVTNKQERFIIPFLPYFIMLGMIGFIEFYRDFKKISWIRVITKVLIGYFIVVNMIAVIGLCLTYTKRSRVESMIFLRQRNDVKGIIMHGIPESPPLPLFYLGSMPPVYEINEQHSIRALKDSSSNYNYLILVGDADLQKRMDSMKVLYNHVTPIAAKEPGFADRLAHNLNPKHNKNETWYIYRLQ